MKTVQIIKDIYRSFSGTNKNLARRLTDDTQLAHTLESMVSEKGNTMSIISDLADLYFHNNPNTQAYGNNARLYSNPEPEALLGAIIAVLANNANGTTRANPVGSIAAKIIFDYFIKDIIGYPKGEAIDTSGGMAANIMAVHLARHYFNPSAKQEGNSILKFILLVSEESHYSMTSAMNLCGFGTSNVRSVTTDPKTGVMDIDDLQRNLECYRSKNYSVMVVSTLGTTVLGAIDNIKYNQFLCDSFGAWHHVDASWGGAVGASSNRQALAGIECADSVTVDTHKSFKATLTCGIIATKHVGLLQKANYLLKSGKYLFDETAERPYDNGHRGLECGKADRTFSFFTLLAVRGKTNLRKMIDVNLQKAQYFKDQILLSEKFILKNKVDTFNVCVQVESPFEDISHSDFTHAVGQESLKSDSSFSMTQVCNLTNGEFVFRFVFSNTNMKNEHIHRLLEELLATANTVKNKILNKQKQVI